ncbi:MAG: hypothetical protein SGJ20_09960 [Planctomycetota bacterium]|nr:hypothetical protein [Planctomycetota bacterium]
MKHWFGFLLATMSLTVIGCGRAGVERASIDGNVSINGQPVESGSIRFISLEPGGGPSVGGQIQDGKYDIDEQKGPTLGKHRVEVQVPFRTGRKIRSPFALPPTNPAEATDPAAMVDEWAEKAPPQYNTKSTLSVTIEPGQNEHDIEMRSK